MCIFGWTDFMCFGLFENWILSFFQTCQDTLKQTLEETDMSQESLDIDYSNSKLIIPSPSVYNLTHDVALSNVINNCRLLQTVIADSDQTEDPNSLHKDLVLPAVQVLLENTSPSQADLTLGWLTQKVLPSFTPDVNSRQDLIAVGLQSLDKIFKSAIQVVAHHSLVTRAREMSSNLDLPQQG